MEPAELEDLEGGGGDETEEEDVEGKGGAFRTGAAGGKRMG